MLSVEDYEKIAEAVLFSSSQITATEMASCLEIDVKTTRKILKRLADSYDKNKRGIMLLCFDDTYQLCSRKDYADYILKLGRQKPGKILTTSLLETLAIITYKQPVTKAQIEEIRGVNADHAVNRLIEYGLVVELGRSESAGRALLFGTSPEFLRDFGFSTIKELPDISDF